MFCSLKQLVNSLDRGFVVHSFDAAMNLVPRAVYKAWEANKTEADIYAVMVGQYHNF